MNNDVGFLVIFIILPTVLIVSGFWLILFVRSDLRARGTDEASTSDAVAADLDDLARDAVIVEDVADKGVVAQHDPAVETSELESATPTTAVSPPSDAEEEFWTPPPVEEPVADEMGADSAPLSEDDERIPEPVIIPPPPSEEFADTANLPSTPEEEADEAGPDEAGQDEVFDTEPEEEESEDEDDRMQRRPAARMVPSTDNVRRRTGQPPRRAPAINRSNVSDEDPVERPDSG